VTGLLCCANISLNCSLQYGLIFAVGLNTQRLDRKSQMAYNLHLVFTLITERIRMSPTISLEQLQDILHIDRHTLLKSVKLCTGKTFRELRSSRLLEHISEHFTNDPSSSLKEISFDAGYSSQRSLSRFIKAQVGKSPKVLRQDLFKP
jgi:AraC-like DNA-binding protein